MTAEPETPAVVDDPTPATEEPGPTDDLPEPAEDPAENPAVEPGATETALCDAVHRVDQLWEAWWEGAFDDGTLTLHSDDALDEWPTPHELRAQVEEVAALEGFATLVADECPDLETAVTDVGG